jgi:hypothetical protein
MYVISRVEIINWTMFQILWTQIVLVLSCKAFFISWFTGLPMLKFPISEREKKIGIVFLFCFFLKKWIGQSFFFFFFPLWEIFQKNSHKPTNKKKA